MIIHNVKQGEQAWHDLRDKHFSASEAAAVMGDHKYMSRDDLLKQYATGIKPEVSLQQQKLFDRGHASEALARPIAEAIIGSELYPVTATDDNGWLLASMDGLDMLGEIGFEHKLYSEKLAAQVGAGKLDMHYVWQLEHQALVTGCTEILFMTSDGTEENCAYFTYEPDAKLQQKLVKAWQQFEKDLAEYKTKLAAGEIDQPKQAQSEVVRDLPAITYKMNGLALKSDLSEFKSQAAALIKKSQEPLVTDDDFATAETLVKTFSAAETRIKSLSEQVIGEVQDIDAFIKDLKQIGEEIRQARLSTEKQVKAEKETRRQEIINKAQHDLSNHIQAQQAKLDGYALPDYKADFAGALKGKKTIESLQSAANDELARAKIDISQQADEGTANLKAFNELAADHKFLFADLQQNLFKPADDFLAMVKSRIADHKAAEEQRLAAERERIRQEEAGKAAKAARQAEAELLAAEHNSKPAQQARGGDEEKPAIAEQRPAAHIPRPSNQSMIQVIASHYGVSQSVAAGWIKEMAVAA